MYELISSLNSAKRLLNVTSAALVFNDGYVLSDEQDELMHNLVEAFPASPPNQHIAIEDLAVSSLSEVPFWKGLLEHGGLIVSLLDVPPPKTAYLLLVNASSPLSFSDTFEQDLAFIENVFKRLFQIDPSKLAVDHDYYRYDDLLALADENSSMVAILDTKLRFEYANRKCIQTLSSLEKGLVGQFLQNTLAQENYLKVKDGLSEVLAGDKRTFYLQVDKGNELLSLEVTCTPRQFKGRIVGLFFVAHDVTVQQRRLQTLRDLHRVTANPATDLQEKLQDVLAVGAKQYNLPFGIISSIEGDNYTVKFCVSPNDELQPETTFALGETYCVHALNSDEPTYFHYTAQSEIKDHPCYKKHGLESYIGAVIHVNGERWGTLNFSGPDPKKAPFNEDDIELMKLLAQWVGNELTRYNVLKDLAASEQQQRLLLNTAYDGFLGIDKNGFIVFANDAACDTTGYSHEEMLGQHHHLLLHHSHPNGEPYSLEDCPVTQTLETGISSRSSAEHLWGKQGSLVCEFNCVAMKRDDGQVEGAVITFQDRTEQLKVEREILEQKKLFESLFMDAPSAIALVNGQREIIMVNPAFCSLFGYSNDELLGQSTAFLYADDKEFERIGERYYSPDSLHRHPLNRVSYVKKNGQVFYCETAGSMIQREDGSIQGYIGHLNDITDRLQVEKEILKANQRFAMASQAAGIGVWEWDLRTNHLEWDDWMYRLFGIAKEDVNQAYDIWSKAVHPDDAAELNGQIERTIQGYGNLDTHFRIIRLDGQIRYLKAFGVVEYDVDGQPIRLIGVNLDITSQMETEAILRKASHEAEMASKAKSDFLATMSHEIRTPLNGVLGMAELLSGSNLDSEQTSQLSVLRDSGESLLELINEILDFSKIEAGQLTIEFVDFDLEKILFDVVRLLMVGAEKKKLDLLVEYPSSLPKYFVGDAFRIKQVLINLVGNAIKFTHEGQVVIRVAGSVNSLGHAQLYIDVQDSGVGISEEVQKILFNAFTQADSSTTRKFGGTGLGLAITKQLVELMGGSVSLKSKVDEGSTFTVSLTLAESYIKALPEKVDFSEWYAANTLLVDDNDINLMILSNQLLEFGIEADQELNAKQAFERVKQAIQSGKPYDLIILDYQMPEWDGLTLSQKIREYGLDDYRPAIVLASSSGHLKRSELKAAGVNVCLTKPIDSRTLTFGLDLALNNRVVGELVSYFDQENNSAESALDEDPSFIGSVLVVEDMKANLAVARGLIERMGLTVIEAENGAVAIEKWQAFRPDLILMDLHMPVMDGLTAMRSIRHAEQGQQNARRTPIYALTADAVSERLTDVERAGGDGLISKPFKKRDLIRVFEEYLVHGSQPEETEQMDAQVGEIKSQSVVLERRILDELKAVLGDDLSMLIDAFFADSSAIVDRLASQVRSQSIDYDVVAKSAHSMKSISLNLGGVTLSGLAGELETQAKAQATGVPALIDALLSEYEKFAEALNKER